MNEHQREALVSRAADEALRLNVKEHEGEVDRDMGASKVDAAAEAAGRLKRTGMEFEVRTEHRSQHGSIYVSVRSKRPPLAARIVPKLPAVPRGAARAVVIVAAVLSLIVIGVWAIGGRVVTTGQGAPKTGSALATSTTKAIKFTDGDTLTISSLNGISAEEKVRLLAIDTPERGQPYFAEASSALTELVGNKAIALEFERPGKLERDKYGRVLAYVIVDGRNVNVEMVRQGWTAYVTKYGGSRFAKDLVAAEEEARAAQRGIWSSR